MKPIRLIALLLWGGALPAALLRGENPVREEFPPHPTTILYQSPGGSPVPVVGASGRKPQIEVGGKRQSISPEGPFVVTRAKRYAPGKVDIRILSVESRGAQPTDMHGIRDVGHVVDLGVNIWAKITPEHSLKNCYFVLVLFNRAFQYNLKAEPHFTYFFKNVGGLAARESQEISVDIDAGKMPPEIRRFPGYFFLVFSGGLQLESNQEQIAAAVFRQQEVLAHQQRLRAYLQENAAGNHPLESYLEISPVLPADTALDQLPKSVEVTAKVGTDGTLGTVTVAGGLPDPVADAVARAVSGWLYLPQIQDGQPAAAEIKLTVPLRD